jgi:hypothetical protein
MIYRLLGLLAPVSRRLSRFRLNLISGNLFVMIFLAASVVANTNRVMREGTNNTTPLVVIVVACVLLLSCLWLWLNKAVVFAPSDTVPIPGSLQKPMLESLLVSGVFTSDGRTWQFFTNAPGSLTRAESGDSGVITLVDGALSVWGTLPVEHPGMWVAPIRAGSITDLQSGHVFWGQQKLPAVRFRFVNKITKQPDRAVIASAELDPLSALRSLNLA